MNPLKAQAQAGRIVISRAAEGAPLVTQCAPQDRRPFLHPLQAPDGAGVLTEDAPAHHPWQHGLYVGLNDVNGYGFWTEGLQPQRQALDGTFHPRPLAPPRLERNRAAWAVETEWRAPGGAALLQERQAWQLEDRGAWYLLDLEWSLTACTALRFGAYAYGGLFLRMPYRAECEGEALNSAGQRKAAAEAQRARWVAVWMRLQGRATPAGLAILDHPGNPEHPSPWRVDGQLGIGPGRCIAGGWTLEGGQTQRARYRVLAFCGVCRPDWVEEQWRSFV